MPQALQRAEARPQLTTRLARNVSEVRAAQRLRYRVFAQEMGARVPGRGQGIDCDLYDAYCDHLLVTDEPAGEVVGTYRLLTAAQARRAGGFYSDGEFDLAALDGLRDGMVEAGRACVHPDYRGGAVLALLWAGILNYVLERGCRYLVGCASVPLHDGGAYAAQVYRALVAECAAPPELTVYPRRPWPLPGAVEAQHAALPALLKGYRRLGACVCGAPAWDRDFGTADLFMLLPTAGIAGRYVKRWTR